MYLIMQICVAVYTAKCYHYKLFYKFFTNYWYGEFLLVDPSLSSHFTYQYSLTTSIICKIAGDFSIFPYYKTIIKSCQVLISFHHLFLYRQKEKEKKKNLWHFLYFQTKSRALDTFFSSQLSQENLHRKTLKSPLQ